MSIIMPRQRSGVKRRIGSNGMVAATSKPVPMDRKQEISNTVPDCLQCGACCFSGDPRYVRVTGDDHERLGDQAEAFTRFIENRCYMRIEGERCAALRIDPVQGVFRCRVYALRPRICRDLEPGSAQCEAERMRKADRAREALEGCRCCRSGAE